MERRGDWGLVVCPGCGEKNRDTARFCTYCGTTLALRCGVCDTEVPSGGRFCDSCGTPVDPSVDAAPASQAPATAARKVVTVLFADLTGSTALEERMDAESVRQVLDRFYAAMRAEVERHGGRVVKFTGDGCMAAFGVPEVREDDAARAVDAALAMRGELEQLASDLQLELSLKVGINTGEVVVSETDDDVVGDSVNVASRLEGAATSGEILVGEDTWRLTRATSRYEPIQPLTLKGKSEPVPAYRLLSVDERTADSAAAPFVGREGELGRLLAAYQDAVDANAARLVTIIGSPGLGKTRLARELLAELSDVARVRETRCDPAGESTFAPIADVMRQAVGISELDSEDEVVAKLAARLPEDDEDRDRIAMRAAAILGVGLAGTTEETFWAIRRLIENGAREQPVVLFLDDVHWAEPLLLDLIEHLAEWITDAPVLLVSTARPELRDLRPSLAEGGRAAAVIALEGLDQRATAQLALNLLETDSLPSELLAKIPASTEGNPLFVRELVRMLVDDHVLLRTGDGWIVTRDVDAIEVPPTISSLLAARIDRLRSDERTIVELASVVGKEFYRGVLHELAPPATRDLVDGVLESLRRKELVEPVGTYWIDEPVFRFHHVLIRDAAYRRLLKESRAELHEGVASWLQAKTEHALGEHDELVGYHLEQAHEYKRQLGRPDEALALRAADLLGRAAQRALDRDDLPAAAALSGRALDRLPMGAEERPGLLLVRCEALLSMDDVSQGALALDEFEALATTPRMGAWATCFSGHLANLTAPERSQETEERVAAAAAELLSLGDQAGAAKAYTVLAQTLAKRGRFAECESVLDDALTAARAANDRRRITATLGFLPHAVLWGPLVVSRAGGRCLDIVRLLRITTGSPAVEATSLRCQAVLEAFRGRTDPARRMLRSARRTLTELGLQNELLDTEMFAGIVELVAGDASAAIERLQESYEGYSRAGVYVLAAQSAALLARAHTQLGELDVAWEFVETSERLASGDLKATVDSSAVRAELLARRGEFAAARAAAEKAVDLAATTDALFDHGNALRSLAAVLRAAGDAAGATGAEDRALALFERKGATALLVRYESAAVVAAAHVSPSPTTVRPNTCARQIELWAELVNRGDRDAVIGLYAPNAIREDRRAGLQSIITGRAAVADEIAQIVVEGTQVSNELVATRGERLALMRSKWAVQRSGFTVEHFSLDEIDDEGRFTRLFAMDADDIDAAFAELDERYLAGEGAEHADVIRAALRGHDAFNRRDWESYADSVTEDIVLADHRPASLGTTVGREAFIRVSQELVALVPDYERRYVSFDAVTSSRFLAELRLVGTSTEGAPVEGGAHIIGAVRGDRVERYELFPLDALDAARARFDELARATSALTNSATRAAKAVHEGYVAGDWDRVRRVFAANYHSVDARSGYRLAVDADAQIEEMRSAREVGGTNADDRVLAIRGDRLCLNLHTFSARGDDPFIVDLLNVIEVNQDGEIVSSFRTNVEDIDRAFAELDERYVAGEGAPFADTLGPATALLGDARLRDWEAAHRDAFWPDAVFIDRSPVGRGRLDVDGFIDSVRQIVDIAREWRSYWREIHRLSEGGVVATLVLTGVTAEGAEVDIVYTSLYRVREGRIDRLEFFAENEVDAALARSAELEVAPSESLGPQPDVLVLENAATRCNERTAVLMATGAWEAAPESIADDVLLDDRRRSIGSVGRGRHLWVANFKAIADLGLDFDFESEVLAIRGDRLCLIRGLAKDADGNEMPALQLDELDEDGRVCRYVWFDADDPDAAFAELDRRYLEIADHAEVWRMVVGTQDAHAARDWERLAAFLAEDVVLVDHRPASLGRVRGRDAYVEPLKALVEVVPDLRIQATSVVAISANAVAYTVRTTGTNAEAGVIDIQFYVAGQVSNGLARHTEFIPLEQRDLVLTRFAELDATPLAITSDVTRATAAFGEAFARRDWDAMSALFADDVVRDDRRTGIGGTAGKTELVQAYRTIAELGYDTCTFEPIAARGSNIALHRVVTSGEHGFENHLLALTELDASGRFCRVQYREVDDLAGALEEIDRWAGVGGAAAGMLPETAATRAADRLVDAISRVDADAFKTVYNRDVVVTDHRQGLKNEIRGRDAALEFMQVIAVSGFIAHHEPQAARGERLGVTKWILTQRESGFVTELLAVGEIDSDGALLRIDMFEADDMASAVALLDELFIEGEGAPYADVIRRGNEQREALRRGDFAAYAALMDPDVVLVDHRPASLGEVHGVEEVLRVLRALSDVMRGMRPLVRRYHALAADMTLLEVVASGVADHGGVIEMAHHRLQQWRNGRVVRMELFPMDELADARAAFARLSALEARQDEHWAPENAASRTAARLFRSTLRGDWDAFRSLASPDYRLEDRRAGLRWETSSLDDTLARQTEYVGTYTSFRNTRLATWGERLAIFWQRLVEASGFESERLLLSEVDEHGRNALGVFFDGDDYASAFAELARRYAAGEGSDAAATVGLLAESALAHHRRDWAAFAEMMQPDVVLADHRPAGAGTLSGRDAAVAYAKTYIDVVPDAYMATPEIYASRGDVMLRRLRVVGTTDHGAAAVNESLTVFVQRDGRFARIEQFPVDRLDDALARFDELAPHSDDFTLENRCTRVLAEQISHYRRGDFDAGAELYADDFVRFDRSRVLQTEDRGREGILSYIRASFGVGYRRFEGIPIAIRGDRLALIRWVVEDETGLVSERLAVYEIHEDDDLIVRSVTFDTADFDAALDELTDRFVTGEAADCAEQIRIGVRLQDAFNRGDWRSARDLLADDFVLEDHRPIALGTLDGDAYIESLTAFDAVHDEWRIWAATVDAFGPDGTVARTVSTGTSKDGARIDHRSTLTLAQVVDGKVARIELFPSDRVEHAKARLRELGAEESGAEAAPTLENRVRNRAADLQARITQLARDGTVEELLPLAANNVVFEDHRPTLRVRLEGRDAVVDFWRVSIPGTASRSTTIAVRGECLCLEHVNASMRDGFDVELLCVNEFDGSGRVILIALFDQDDLGAALDRLDERYLLGEGAPFAAIWSNVAALQRARHDRDWDAIAALIADDHVLVDHRDVSLGSVNGGAAYVEAVKSLQDVIPDSQSFAVRICAIGTNRALYEVCGTGTNSGGGTVEMPPVLVVAVVEDVKRTLTEYFSSDRLDDALARFEELGTTPPQPARRSENAASRAMRHVDQNLIEGKPEASRSLYSKDVELYDVRAGVRLTLRGVDERIADMRSAFDVGVRHVDTTVVATRGDRLSLHRLVFSGSDPETWEMEFLSIAELDDDGLIRFSYRFDGSDLAGAIDLLDERYLLGEGAPFADYLQHSNAYMKAINALDVDAMREVMAEDCVYVDHRPASFGTMSRDEWLQTLAVLRDLMVEYQYIARSYLRIDLHGSLIEAAVSGRTVDDTLVDRRFMAVGILRDDVVVRIEMFDEDDLDAAVATFERLVRQEKSLENACVRNLRRFVDAWERGDFERMRTLFHEDFVAGDARSFQERSTGVDDVIKSAKVTRDLGLTHFEIEPLSTRGDRFAAVRIRVCDDADNEMVLLGAFEVHADGRALRGWNFEPEDEAGMLTELDRIYRASEEADGS